ncbi:hypothetical protein ACFQ08_13520, partial [Streptosporangium algeriense]
IVLINPTDYFLYLPLLPEVAAVLATRSRSAHTLATGNAVFAFAWGVVSLPLPVWGDLLTGIVGLPLVVGAFFAGTRQWAITVGPPATPP